MIDCSHGNAGKNYRNQPLVLESVMNLIENGETNICGFMIESHIKEGAQKPRCQQHTLPYNLRRSKAKIQNVRRASGHAVAGQ